MKNEYSWLAMKKNLFLAFFFLNFSKKKKSNNQFFEFVREQAFLNIIKVIQTNLIYKTCIIIKYTYVCQMYMYILKI